MDSRKYFDRAYAKAEQDRLFHCGQYDDKDMALWGFYLGIKFAEENSKTVEYFMGENLEMTEHLDKDEATEWFYETFSDEIEELYDNYAYEKNKFLDETSQPFVSELFNQTWKNAIFNDEWRECIASELMANFSKKLVDIDVNDVVDYIAYSVSIDIFENN